MYEATEIRDIPNENSICRATNELYLYFPTINYFRNVQCRLVVAFTPNPDRKVPKATNYRLTENTNSSRPTMVISQEQAYVLFLPQLSAIWDIPSSPTKEPRNMKNCKKEDIHLLEQIIIISQSTTIEDGRGYLRWEIQNQVSSSEQTYSSQEGCSSSSSEVHTNQGAIQMKLRQNMIIPARIHFTPKWMKRRS